MYLQPGGPATVVPLTPGQAPLHYALPEFDVTLEFEPTDFIQVNGALNQTTVRRAIEFLDPRPGERVLDLFCGLGNFSLPLATRSREVLGIEGEAGLVQRARRNAEANGVANVRFETADLASSAGIERFRGRAFDRVLLDPPRAGAKEVLPIVAGCGANRVVYIFCHPGSLARDAGLLVREHGFRLAAAGVVDMFPHTTHVEAMAIFVR